MGIKKLKKENEFLNMTIADMLAKFDTSKTKKYSQFLVRLLNERIEDWKKNEPIHSFENNPNPIDRVAPINSWENSLVRSFVCEWLFSWGNMERFVEFTELMEKGLVKENDISKYDSWDMLQIQLFEAKNREMFKKSKKEIHKIFEDENYMIFKPLTYLASCSYGYQTKWCTAMINEPSYFYNHSKGILIYLIDKKENKKFAFYKNIPQPYEMDEYNHEDYVFKTFNQEDKQIDTIQTGLPMNILQIVMMECDTKLPTTIANYKLFSEDEKNIMRQHIGNLPGEYGSMLSELEEKQATEEVAQEETPIRVFPRLRRMRDLVPVSTVNMDLSEQENNIISELKAELTKHIEEHETQHRNGGEN
jgi:hypothetical protein